MDIVDALSQLGDHYGISLSLSREHTCRLIFETNIFVDMETPGPQSTEVVLHGLVGIVPTVAREPVYQLMLEANLFGRGTDGATLAVDFEQGEVILHRAMDLRAMPFEQLKDVVERFATQMKGWTQQLSRSLPTGTDPMTIDETFIRA